jgi:hypothetical protein
MKKIEIIIKFLSSNKWMRIIYLFLSIGFVLFVVLKDNSCSYGDFNCDSKSKINVNVENN